MDIYQEGELDIAKATAELQTVPGMHNEGNRKTTLAILQTAALIDIAASLRVVAEDAALGLLGGGDTLVDEPEEEPMTDETRDFFVVGDHVIPADPELVDPGTLEGTITALGMSEGAAVATVDWNDDAGTRSKIWTSALIRVPLRSEVPEPGEIPGPSAGWEDLKPGPIEEISIEKEDVVDDIDSDFDGDAHSEAAAALEVLKANEAERKAKKKGSKK